MTSTTGTSNTGSTTTTAGRTLPVTDIGNHG